MRNIEEIEVVALQPEETLTQMINRKYGNLVSILAASLYLLTALPLNFFAVSLGVWTLLYVLLTVFIFDKNKVAFFGQLVYIPALLVSIALYKLNVATKEPITIFFILIGASLFVFISSIQGKKVAFYVFLSISVFTAFAFVFGRKSNPERSVQYDQRGAYSDY